MNPATLTPAEAMDRISASESEIRAPGVHRLALFGSVLRGTWRVFRRLSDRGFWQKRKMSFEPREYLRHILAKADP